MTEEKDDIIECNEECGCEEEEHDIMYLTLDDDTELECYVLGIFQVEGMEGKEYIALLPVDEEEVIIYEFVELEDEEFELLAIEEEEEFELVSQTFHDIF